MRKAKIAREERFANLADGLTLIRGILLPAVMLICLLSGTGSLVHLWGLVVLGWITDILDGKLARRADNPTHIGEKEILYDTFMLAAAAIYILVSCNLPGYLRLITMLWILSVLPASIYGLIRCSVC